MNTKDFGIVERQSAGGAATPLRFVPAADAQPAEVIRLMPFLWGRPITDADWAALGTATRHLAAIEVQAETPGTRSAMGNPP
jgi:hypothetical protein